MSVSSPMSLAMMESPMMTCDPRNKLDSTSRANHQQNQRIHTNAVSSLNWSDIGSNNNVYNPNENESRAHADDLLTMSDIEPEFYHTPIFSPQAVARQQKYRVLGSMGLVGLTFFVSCGGPIGSEPLVAAGGPLVGLIAIACYVTLCVLPFLYVIAELCSAFPENGGYTVWIMTAFGPFWGFQVGYWSWTASVLNNALYPGLVYSTIADAYSIPVQSQVLQYVIKLGIACVLAVPSLVGVRFAALGAFTLLVLVSLMILFFSTWGFVDGANVWSNLFEHRPVHESITSVISSSGRLENGDPSKTIDWVLLVNSLYWNFDGLHDASIVGGEVRHPSRTYPRVLFLTLAIAVAMYVLPLLAAVTSDRYSWRLFDEDAYPVIAEAIGGSVLHHIVLISSLLSLAGLFATSVMFQSFQVLGLAQLRLLPSAFRYRHKSLETPQYAVLLSLLATTLLLGFDYESILALTNALSAGIQVMIVLAMLKLRKVLPFIPRPTRVPGQFGLLCALLLPTTTVFVYILTTTLFEPRSALVLCGLVLPGVVYGLVRRRRMQLELQQRVREQLQIRLQQTIRMPAVALP